MSGNTETLQVATREEATPAVVRLVSLATEQAERLVDEANNEAQRKLNEAKQQAYEITTDARTRAERIESEARVTAEQMTRDAQSRADRVNGEVDRIVALSCSPSSNGRRAFSPRRSPHCADSKPRTAKTCAATCPGILRPLTRTYRSPWTSLSSPSAPGRRVLMP